MLKRLKLLYITGWVILAFCTSALEYSQAATLNWAASSGSVDGYRVYYGSNPTDRSKCVDVGSSTRCDLDALPLDDNRRYYFSVSAYNIAGESAPSPPVVFTPGDNTPPSPPIGLSAD